MDFKINYNLISNGTFHSYTLNDDFAHIIGLEW